MLSDFVQQFFWHFAEKKHEKRIAIVEMPKKY